MIIWLASYPRSGNTFFRLLLNRLYGLQTHSVYADRQVGKIARIVGHAPMDRPLPELATAPEMHIIKTHDLPSDDAHAALYLVRDGRDVLVSYARYVLSFEADAGDRDEESAFRATLHDLIAYDASFGGWGPNVLAWSRRPGTAIVGFEGLVDDPIATVRRSLAAIGYAPPELDGPALDGMGGAPMPTFEELHRLMPSFFRRGQVGGWRTEMPDDLHDLFWRRHGGVMQQMGYRH